MERKHKLLFGPYTAPAVSPGDILTCAVRGDVNVGGYSAGRIPWPRVKKTGAHALIVCDDLLRALENESSSAIAYWWGVSEGTVCAWRKALGIKSLDTPGGRALKRDTFEDHISPAAAQRGREKALAPEGIEKMRRSKTGRPAHAKTMAALLAASRRPRSKKWRRSAARSMREQWESGRRDEQKTWTPEEDATLKSMFFSGAPDREIAAAMGKTVAAIRGRRQVLGIRKNLSKKGPSASREHRRQHGLTRLMAEMTEMKKGQK